MFFRYSLRLLLSKSFTLKDKIPVVCKSVGDFGDDFEIGKTYLIYMSTGEPRIYSRGSKEWFFKNTDDLINLPKFRINGEHVKRRGKMGTRFSKYDSGTAMVDKLNDMDEDIENLTDGLSSEDTTGEENMLPERIIFRLNGVSLSEEKLVELNQAVSTGEVVAIDLVHLLGQSEEIKKLNLGKDALVKSIDIVDGQLRMKIKKGAVTKESNGQIAKALQELISGDND